MHYRKNILTKDGKDCLLRGATADDAEAVWDFFILSHGQTDYLLSYPDECGKDLEQERQFLADRASSKTPLNCAPLWTAFWWGPPDLAQSDKNVRSDTVRNLAFPWNNLTGERVSGAQ